MDTLKFELYWNEIPIGRENAIEYSDLMGMWGKNERAVRQILHNLSLYDNGDNYILVRSASGKGFYRTDNEKTIKAYKEECLNKGKSVFAPVKKINRVLKLNDTQYNFKNNLRVVRENKGLKQKDICQAMKKYDKAIDNAMLSKMENSVCLPTPFQLAKFAEIYGCTPDELLSTEFEGV